MMPFAPEVVALAFVGSAFAALAPVEPVFVEWVFAAVPEIAFAEE